MAKRHNYELYYKIYLQGYTTQDLADLIGTSPGTISRGFNTNNLPMRPRGDMVMPIAPRQFDKQLVEELKQEGLYSGVATLFKILVYKRAIRVAKAMEINERARKEGRKVLTRAELGEKLHLNEIAVKNIVDRDLKKLIDPDVLAKLNEIKEKEGLDVYFKFIQRPLTEMFDKESTQLNYDRGENYRNKSDKELDRYGNAKWANKHLNKK